MEQELTSLLEAWHICKNSLNVEPGLYRNAFEYIEKFKQSSNYLLEVGFYLAASSSSSSSLAQPKFDDELIYFGLQLIAHAIKFKWNNANMLSDQAKLEIRHKLFGLIFVQQESNRFHDGPAFLKNSACLTLIELLKREWPQNWPTFLGELCDASAKSLAQKSLAFVTLKYVAEEFLDVENIASGAALPTQRRRDINQYLIAHMPHVYAFFVENLEAFHAAPQSLVRVNQTFNSNLKYLESIKIIVVKKKFNLNKRFFQGSNFLKRLALSEQRLKIHFWFIESDSFIFETFASSFRHHFVAVSSQSLQNRL